MGTSPSSYIEVPPGGEGYFSESNIKLKSLVMGNTKQGSIRLTLFCENYYFTKKITDLRRKSGVKVQKGAVKVQITNLRR